MGGCSSKEEKPPPAQPRAAPRGGAAAQENQPQDRLPAIPSWVHTPGMTWSELERQRRIFWETQPAFGGDKTVWDTLESLFPLVHDETDLQEWKVILDAAEIRLPNNSWEEIYDSKGVRYEVPRYVISTPLNTTDG